ncbi:hypothetical protein [uncultured Paludibaculum sp.]|uniref:hypothetical protein n=1 Tax=uncultured Paludibaculum sp. TaxID=1765020 RepID=UPI002AAB5630|nr:hypothetical protein [uncultured Paludibaculum sp.]
MTNSTVVLLDIALAATLGFLALMVYLRDMPSGPEGPVGAWLLLVPPLFLLGGVLAKIASAGRFDWMPGGRATAWGMTAGLCVAAMVAMWFLVATPDSFWGKVAALVPWLIVGGGFVAVHGGTAPSPVAKACVMAVLGGGGVAGWALVLWGAGLYVQTENQKTRASMERDRAWEQSRVDEFHALGENAELWKYFGYMYLEDEAERKRCRALIAARPNLNASLLLYLGIPTLESSAVDYIADVYEHPPASLAAEYGLFLERKLASWRPALDDTPTPYERRRELAPLFRAAARLEEAGGDLTGPLTVWRDYLRTLKGLNDLADEIDTTLKVHAH